MQNKVIHLSVVSPVFRAEFIVDHLVERLIHVLENMNLSYEIILVEDGSPDQSWEKILENASKFSQVKGIKLSRNFGQHQAISAGLSDAKGEWIVVMDCDLQDRPEEIPHLYQKALEGFDLVVAQRTHRKDHIIKKYSSHFFYRAFSYLTETKQDSSVANFGIYSRKVISSVLEMKDQVRAFPILVQWVGFKRTEYQVQHDERAEGKSSYTYYKLIKLAFDIIISFSTKPLRLVLLFGLLITFISFCTGIFYFTLYCLGSIKVPGFASIVISIWFLSGVIIATLGIIGLYLGKTFEQVKSRPLFIIDKKVNTNESDLC